MNCPYTQKIYSMRLAHLSQLRFNVIAKSAVRQIETIYNLLNIMGLLHFIRNNTNMKIYET
jgi:hypothetical protein